MCRSGCHIAADSTVILIVAGAVAIMTMPVVPVLIPNTIVATVLVNLIVIMTVDLANVFLTVSIRVITMFYHC